MSYIRKTADIFISKEFETILKKIQDNSEIAKMLLRTRQNVESLCDGFVNFISVAQTDNMKISYLTQDRITKLQESGEFDDVWRSSKRFSAKPGAFVRKIFKGISDSDVEKFSTLYRNAQSTPDFTFKVVDGKEILKYYLYESYADQTASLGASCMKHRNCQSFLNIYTENPETIKLLIMLDQKGFLLGRALLWNIEPKIMDRIYTIDDEEYSWHFKNWADTNGYLYKKEQKWNNTLYFESKGKTSFLELSVKLKNFKYHKQPYLDTFKFLDQETGTFYNYIPSKVNVVTFSTPDGNPQPDDFLALDQKTKLFYHYNDLIWLDYAGIRTHPNNTFYSEIYDISILKEDAKLHEELRDYIFLDDSLNNLELIDSYLEQIRKREEDIRNSMMKLKGKKKSLFYDMVVNRFSSPLGDYWIPIEDEQESSQDTQNEDPVSL